MTCSSVLASSDTETHPHSGKVTPFQPGDPNVPLPKEALEILEMGKPFKTQIQSGSSGRGLVVQDVHAPTDIVWDRILDFDHYADMVPKTVYSQNYQKIHHTDNANKNASGGGNQTIYTEMRVGFPMLKLRFFIRHEYFAELNSLTWTLDYNKKSDLDDSCGYWYVIPHPDKPRDWSRVYYSVDVSMFDWIPSFVVNFMSKQALTEATGWVKKYSELEFSKRPPVDYTAIEEKEKEKEKEPNSESLDEQKPLRRPQWVDRFLDQITEQIDHITERINSARGGGKCDDNSVPETCCSDDEDEDDSSVDSSLDSSVSSLSSQSLLPPPPPSEPNTSAEIVTRRIGWTRYCLVASVVGLALYNIHLYFSQ